MHRFGASGAHPGTGGYVSLLLVAAAGMISSVVMLHSDAFHRAAGWMGILASGLDLAYCLGYALVPARGELLALVFIPAAGLFLAIWHILIGWRLYRLGRRRGGTAR